VKQPLAYGCPSMVTATTAEVAPACLECGTCCFSKLTNYVRVDGADHARIGDRVDELTVFDGNRCYMRMSAGHCAALVVDVVTSRFVCSIYGARPAVCRELERGSPACRGELHEKDQRPPALLRMLIGEALVK
jgi:Fe-S-cluster containining protein